MPSQKQLDANRRNSQKSTGPRTPEGRAAVSHNAVTHGLTAGRLLVDTEYEDAFNELSEAFQDEYQPRTPTGNTLLEQLVCAAWRLRRVRVIEQGIFDDQLSQTADDKDLTDSVRLGRVFRRDSSGPQALVNLSRYETRIERSYYKALHELQRLHDRRDKEDLAKQTHLAPAPAALDLHRLESPPSPDSDVTEPRALASGRAILARRAAPDLAEPVTTISRPGERARAKSPKIVASIVVAWSREIQSFSGSRGDCDGRRYPRQNNHVQCDDGCRHRPRGRSR